MSEIYKIAYYPGSVSKDLSLKKIHFIHIEIKSWRTEKNICLLKVCRNMTMPTQTAVRTKDHHISSGVSQTPWSLHEQFRNLSISGLWKQQQQQQQQQQKTKLEY